MVVCRKRGDYRRSFKALSCLQRLAARSRTPGSLSGDPRVRTLRKAGNGGWYWEVNRLSDLSSRIVPFFDRFSGR